ncbi:MULTISPECIES: LysR family transcriptional regulator [unclassified Solwaraspora]|uniref:LysR family transcriptional regulator n=1 Tax=unclassified Solwaraspora TaxID=2627926 RepID=UPI00248ACD54|nr:MULTISPECIES: LysR family transcriptional regulator [unclassified Solwaraspora]WBB96639.1 LysR family transcriptional regulator [Solwaraspora sp. WMMA2059]WBC19457.1 LysR family transcriptional regulator [Solwaraspora sp. WMMA2080]WJK32960.1 LysR family transcriptional regulator [Solwaraspora sp. WMMA2065]
MDVVAACRAFVAVSAHGSFTIGAAAARIPQSVASRRIATLEQHLGARLFDRSSRAVTLTAFGRDVLPSARRLVDFADTLEHNAEQARLRPLRLAVPAICPPRRLARLVTEARTDGLQLDLVPADPAERADLVHGLEVRAALLAVAPDGSRWQVPLGLAGSSDGSTGDAADPIFLAALRPGRFRRDRAGNRIWIQPEDDVPHVRDRMVRLAQSVGLAPAQVRIATGLVAALADVYGGDSGDLLLCSASQARDLGLRWHPIGEQVFARGYDIAAGLAEDARRLHDLPDAVVRTCLGAPPDEQR